MRYFFIALMLFHNILLFSQQHNKKIEFNYKINEDIYNSNLINLNSFHCSNHRDSSLIEDGKEFIYSLSHIKKQKGYYIDAMRLSFFDYYNKQYHDSLKDLSNSFLIEFYTNNGEIKVYNYYLIIQNTDNNYERNLFVWKYGTWTFASKFNFSNNQFDSVVGSFFVLNKCLDKDFNLYDYIVISKIGWLKVESKVLIRPCSDYINNLSKLLKTDL